MVKRVNTLIGVSTLFLSTTDAFIVRDGKQKTFRPPTFTPPEDLPVANTVSSPNNLKASTLEGYEDQETARFAPFLVSSTATTTTIPPFSSPQQEQRRLLPDLEGLKDFLAPVLSASFLITSNTVGAGCLVMPELAAGPGLAATTGIFGAVWLVNLFSGLLLAEVAIKQKEASDNDVPASFKEFAETNLNSEAAGNAVSAFSLLCNGCVQAFTVSRAGLLGSALTGGAIAATPLSVAWAAAVITTLGTQSSKTLSAISSACAAGLFISFGGLLLPGLVAVQDPIGTLMAPGVATDFTASVGHVAPVILMSMIYQNIVPTVTKMMDYDRTKTVTSIVAGSLVPLVMYLAWCYASLGGGIAAVGGAGGALMTLFSLTTLAGSTLGSSMSLAQELKNFFGNEEEETEAVDNKTNDGPAFGLPSAAVAITIPLAAALAFSGGEGFTEALAIAGSFGSPLLYGAIPVAMAWNQRRQETNTENEAKQPGSNLVPGITLPCLGGLSMAFMGQEIVQRAGEVLSTAL